MNQVGVVDNFSISRALDDGWTAIKTRTIGVYGAFVVAMLLPRALTATGMALDGGERPFFAFIFGLAEAILQILISAGFIRIFLDLVDGKTADPRKFLLGPGRLLTFWFTTILYSFIVLAGTLLLIIPGIIWAIQFHFCTYAVVDEGMGPFEAIERSSQLTKGARWKLFLFGFTIGLINLAGFLCLVIGLLFTVPLTMLAIASVFRQLQARAARTGLS